MEPQIQYAKTSDGVSIAFTIVDEATPNFEQKPKSRGANVAGIEDGPLSHLRCVI